jgi:HEAT repeat protein
MVEELLELLKSGANPEDRIEAALRLGESRAPQAIGALVRAYLGEPDPGVREAIVTILLGADDTEVAREVAPLLKATDAGLRSMAFELLAAKASAKSAEVFAGLLQDPDRDVRAMTVHALGRSRWPGALDMLRRIAAEDPDVNVVGTAIEYIGEAGEAADAALVEQCVERLKHPFLDFVAERACARLREGGALASGA